MRMVGCGLASSVYFSPSEGVAADVIPFPQDGEYHLFYLRDFRDLDRHGEGTSWFRVSTRDFVTFEDHGECLERGGSDDQDLYVFTGCVLEAEGFFHIFYTGHNPHYVGRRPKQAVMHAVSKDLRTWKKLPNDTFLAPEGYESDDWRDPFVFRKDDEWWMLLAARLREGPKRRRGCTALCVSRDLRAWEVRDPLYAPGLFFTHECPDLFSVGDWWYLVFSEFSDSFVTRYRMARSPEGPWLTPPVDTFDARAFYAAKSASNGTQRVLFGWNPTRAGETDDGAWEWGGVIVPHELIQRPDGTLGVQLPTQVAASFGAAAAAPLGKDPIKLVSPGFATAAAGPLPDACMLELNVEIAEGTQACGVALRASPDFDSGYQVRIEPLRSRLVFDVWPRPGDVPYMVGLERPLTVVPGQTLNLRIVLEGTVCEIYVDGVALSARLYDHRAGHWGLFAAQGAATWSNVRIRRR
jgi:beta-fructofuranosidase